MLMPLNPLVTHINRYDYRKSGSFAYAHIHSIKRQPNNLCYCELISNED